MRFVHEDILGDYETLLNKSGKCTMDVGRLRSAALGVFYSLNNLNPSCLRNMFIKRKNVKIIFKYQDEEQLLLLKKV